MRQFRMLAEGVLFCLILGILSLGCGYGAAVGPVVSANLTPAAISLNRGATAQIFAQALTSDNVTVGTPDLSFSSDNPGITVSTTGVTVMICAGQWDANFTNCRTTDSGNHPLPLVTTGSPAHITATFTINGQTKTSSAVVVTDHERIDGVKVCAAGSTPGNCIPPSAACVSQNAPSPANTAQFIAQAFSNDTKVCGGAASCQLPDETIGAVDWSVSPPQVGSFIPTSSATTAAGVPVTVTANTPGQGTIIASIGPSDSAQSGTATYTTCGVASIHVHQQNMMPTPPDTATSFSAGVGSTVNLVADVLDSNTPPVSLSNTVGLALNWFSSQPALASVSVGSVGTIAPGFAQITAACRPPACNFGFNPPRPVFSDDVVTADVTGTPDSTVLVTTSTGPTCTANTACSNSDLIVPIDTVTNTAGTAFTLPAGLQVNSMVMTPQGNPAFLGTNCSGTGVTGPSGAACSGLLRFDPTVTTVAAPIPTINGTVLATDGNREVLANPPPCFPPAPGCTSPVAATQVLIVRAGSVIEKTLPIPNATAAAFAIDGSKIYIVAGHQLFIYSTTLGQLTTGLSGTARPLSAGLVAQDVDQEVAFFATGAMAYVADSAGDDVIATCDDNVHSTVSVGPPGSPGPTHIAAVPNGSAMMDANSPNIDEIDASVDSKANKGLCAPVITNSPSSHSFGTSFTAKQLIVTPDSKLAIILTSDQGVLVYAIGSQPPQTFVVQLSGQPTPEPISGGVTPDGANLYVGATDGKVHRLDLTNLMKTPPTPPADVQSIAVNLCPSVPAPGCNPDFLVVRPAATAVTLTSLAVTAPGNSSPTSPTLSVGAMQQFKATGTFSDKTTRDMTNFVTWISSNTNVAVIGPTTSGTQPITTPGLAQALAIGTTSITAISGGTSGSITLTVK